MNHFFFRAAGPALLALLIVAMGTSPKSDTRTLYGETENSTPLVFADSWQQDYHSNICVMGSNGKNLACLIDVSTEDTI